MNLVELTQLIGAIDDKIFRRWEYFLAVVLAITSWLLSKKLDIPLFFSFLLMVGLIFFFIANGFAIDKNVKYIKVLENERECLIKTNELVFYTPVFKEYLLKKSAVYAKQWIWFYCVICILAIAALYSKTSWAIE